MGILSRRTVELMTYWAPTLSTFGASAGLGLLYFTDWEAVLQYVPVVNGKFQRRN